MNRERGSGHFTFTSSFEQQGLYERKDSESALKDHRILDHLRVVAASSVDMQEEEDIYELERQELQEKIEMYNRRNHLGQPFVITQQDLDFEGALRFYYEDDQSELTKAVRLTNKTTVEELIPTLVEKFSLSPALYALYEVHEKEDNVYLYPEECPLARAISARKVPRFVLRLKTNGDIEPRIRAEDSASQVSSASPTSLTSPPVPMLNGDDHELKGKPGRSASETSNSDKLSKADKKILKKQQKSQKGSVSSDSSETTQSVVNGFDSKSEKELANMPQIDEEKFGADGKSKKKKKKSSKSDKNKRSASFSNMLKKNKEEGMMFTPELSTYKLAPGILKVFGDHVSPGSNYKAVRVSTISTAQEVVRMALERYGFENSNPRDYVLCDVVGHFENPEIKQKSDEEAKWVTEYVRAVSDNEKPLVLQSLWKPSGERLRRFELRRRLDIEASCFFINTADGMDRTMSENSLNESERSSVVSTNDGAPASPLPNDKTDSVFTPMAMSPHSKSDKVAYKPQQFFPSQAPLHAPFLLLLQGYKNTLDNLVFKIEKEVSTVGPLMEEGNQCDLVLHSPDALLPHCWIHKKVNLNQQGSETNLDNVYFNVTVEPASGAEVMINGEPVDRITPLVPGQLLHLGKHYLFLFKDPTKVKDPQLKLPWLDHLLGKNKKSYNGTTPVQSDNLYATVTSKVKREDKSVQVEILTPRTIRDTSDESDSSGDESEISSTTAARQGTAILAPRKQVEKSQLQFSYEYKDEDDILHAIIDIAEDMSGFKLTPAYLFMMAIEHSAATFTEIQTRKLLLKISSGLQGIAWEKTKEIGKQGSVKDEDGLAILTRLLPELKPILFWMSISLEMLHFLQCQLSNYLLPREQVATSKEALLTADEELLTVLEEVIMFTFQQTVYHLTKVLYVALPAVIDTNPFQAEDGEMDPENRSSTVHPSILKITEIFTHILSTTKQFQLHPQITSQLFAYLFFFSNASLFNSLMEKGAGGKFYRWTKGVQMRGNVEVMEEWSSLHGLHSQFEQYMSKFVSAVDLLSTPKAQLMQMDWSTMRIDFSALNAAQLQQLLGEYQLSGKPRPRGWFPPPDEVEAALKSTDILESFATHPPLMLPATNFQLELNKAPDDESFYHHLEGLKQKFSKDTGSNQVDLTPNTKRREMLKKAGKSMSVESITPPEVQPKPRSNSKSSTQSSEPAADDVITIETETIVHSEPPEDEPPPRPMKPSAYSKPTPVARKRPESVVRGAQVLTNGVESDDSASVGKSEPSQPSQESKPLPPVPPTKSVSFSDEQDGYSGLLEKAQNLIAKDGDDTDSDAANGDGDAEDNDVEGMNGEGDDAVFFVELNRGSGGLGLGLIDGMFTPLKNHGIYIRTVLPNSPASMDPRLRIGDRILAVNGTSLVGADYGNAMELIKQSGEKLTFLVATSDDDTVTMIHQSSC